MWVLSIVKPFRTEKISSHNLLYPQKIEEETSEMGKNPLFWAPQANFRSIDLGHEGVGGSTYISKKVSDIKVSAYIKIGLLWR